MQARSGSTRLPGKVLEDVEGRPLLAHVIARLQRCRRLDRIVVATSDRPGDDPVEAVSLEAGVAAFRGSEHDVLSRYLGAARAHDAGVIVRITSDCPLIDPATVDRVVDALCDDAASVDYASNVLERRFPRGLDAEAFFRDTLERTARRATSPAAREHVTHYIVAERPDLFSLRSVGDADDHSDLRWTVDEADDLEMVRRLYRDLNLATQAVPYADIVAYVRTHPEIARMNAHVTQKA